MKRSYQLALLSLAACSLAGCIVVARPRVQQVQQVQRPAPEVIIYREGSPPPARAVAWRRSFAFRYYPASQVYYAPDRDCYIWRGPRGWVTTPKPPPQVVLNQADALTVELGDDDPAAFHAEVVARCADPEPAATQHNAKGRDRDRDQEKGNDRDKGKGKDKDKDKGKGKGKDKDKGKG